MDCARLSAREIGRLLSRLQVEFFATRDEQQVAGNAKLMEPGYSVSAKPTPACAINLAISGSPIAVDGVQKPPASASLPISSARHAAASPSIFAVEP